MWDLLDFPFRDDLRVIVSLDSQAQAAAQRTLDGGTE